MIELIVKGVASYLLGSVVGSLVVGRLRGGVDIRTLGSGNAGGTNALRTQGKAFAVWVVLIDVAKGWLAAYGIAALALPFVPAASATVREWLPVACGAAAIIGHVYPVWHGFRGGKGAATLVGALVGVNAWLLVPVLATWVGALILFGYVSLASILAALALPIAVAVGDVTPRVPVLAFGVFVAAVVMFTHRANLARMRQGSEPRARSLWLLGVRRR
ncbi:MAG: glycerol-3-phosphate 1-O-acyltransferase PlsY [Gammaproteobacteria bacterium]